MKTIRPIVFAVIGLWTMILPLAVHGQASAASVPPFDKRQKAIDEARQLLHLRENPIAGLPAELACPFVLVTPDAPEAGPAAPAVHRMGSHEVLQSIAGKITPSGAAIIGDQAILLFGQKKVKVGDHLKITFEGGDYLLEVTTITSTSFTLRLNNEEVTRPIK